MTLPNARCAALCNTHANETSLLYINHGTVCTRQAPVIQTDPSQHAQLQSPNLLCMSFNYKTGYQLLSGVFLMYLQRLQGSFEQSYARKACAQSSESSFYCASLKPSAPLLTILEIHSGCNCQDTECRRTLCFGVDLDPGCSALPSDWLLLNSESGP